MKMKHTALILMLFVGYGLLWGDEPKLEPLTLNIVNMINNAGEDFTSVDYYLSKPFIVLRTEQDNASRRGDDIISIQNRGIVVDGGRGQEPFDPIEFSDADKGTLLRIGRAFENFEVTFKGTVLEFRRNSQGRYDLSSIVINARIYNFRILSGNGPVQLCINIDYRNTESNDPVRGIAALSSPGSINTPTPQPHYGDSSRQPYQINTSYPTGQYSHPSRNIEGRGSVTERGVADYVIHRNLSPSVNRDTLNRLISTYFSEAEFEGINPDIAIAQMLHSTNFLSNQRMTTHNYAGFISTPGWSGRFDSMTDGVRAHIQHLKGYASGRLNRSRIVDPRYEILRKLGYLGIVRTFDQLYRHWTASPASYGNSIDNILNGLYQYSR